MAVIKRMELRGGVAIEQAYLLVNSVSVNRVTGAVRYDVEGYVTQEARRARTEALKRLTDANVDAAQAQEAWAELFATRNRKLAVVKPDQLRAAKEATIAAEAAVLEARKAIESEANLPFFTAEGQVLPSTESELLLDEVAGTITADVSKVYAAIYAYLKRENLPFAGGVDA